MKVLPWMLCLALLYGCSSEDEDIKEFMRKADATIKPRIDPLPLAKPYEPFEYTGFDLSDPFRPRSLREPSAANSDLAPDQERRREALESYPLDALKFVGLLQQAGVPHALIRADTVLHRVKVGNYLGQDYGQIVEISEAEVKVKERVQDGDGAWTIRDSSLRLSDEAESQGNTK